MRLLSTSVPSSTFCSLTNRQSTTSPATSGRIDTLAVARLTVTVLPFWLVQLICGLSQPLGTFSRNVHAGSPGRVSAR